MPYIDNTHTNHSKECFLQVSAAEDKGSLLMHPLDWLEGSRNSLDIARVADSNVASIVIFACEVVVVFVVDRVVGESVMEVANASSATTRATVSTTIIMIHNDILPTSCENFRRVAYESCPWKYTHTHTTLWGAFAATAREVHLHSPAAL